MKVKLLGQNLDLDSGFENLESQLKKAFPLDHISKIWATTTAYNWGGSGRYNQIEITGSDSLEGKRISLHFFDQSPNAKLYTLHIVDKSGYYTIIEQNPNYEICEESLRRFSKIVQIVEAAN